MSNVTALEEIRQDKKLLENMIQTLCREFEEKYPGFKVEQVDVNRNEWPNHCDFRKFLCELQIKIPWL